MCINKHISTYVRTSCLYSTYINQHVNTDILTTSLLRALETSIPLCDIDTNVSMSPLRDALII